MNPLTLLAILSEAMTAIPKVVTAVQTIMASDAALTIKQAFEQFFAHNTAGQPNAPALSPTAKPLVPDFQAPKA